MSTRRPQSARNALLGLLSLGLLLNFVINPAMATHTPANKATAVGSKVVKAAPGQNVTLMAATLRTSSTKDLLLNVSLECSILTQLITNNDNATSTARGAVRVWIEIDGAVVPINDVSSPGDSTPGIGDDTDKVTFCDREYSRTVTDTEDPQDGIDEIKDYIKTKSSHSFQWVSLNLGSGVHEVVVKSDLTTAQTSSATAEAYVGNRTLVIEPTSMANDIAI
jgi:hypothetical protein